jgi:peptidoglycan/xylan/chitin deacetylase (PgdA/CDA1 family)
MQAEKWELVARACASTRLTRLLEWMPQRQVLMILNYHRIGDAAETRYDPGVFSATAEEFEAQITYIKHHFHIATLQECLAMINGGGPPGASVLITFDDGYIDNYTLAFPVLRSHGMQAVFFLATAFVGTGHLPWWDTIAYIVKQSRTKLIRLYYPEPATFDLEYDGVSRVTTQILRLYKQSSMKDHEHFCAELEAACETSRPQGDLERCFMNWEEAREMQRAGMAFGSHTHTHQILTTLAAKQQQEEFGLSREILEHELGTPVDVLAYPFGARHAFSADSIHGLKNAGYRAAFSFYGGLNCPGKIQPFDIRRDDVGHQSFSRLRLQTTLGALTAKQWF